MFIKVNGRITDFEDYKRKIVLIKNYSKHYLKEELAKHGFRQVRDKFYNDELDLEIEVTIKKKHKMEFV